MGTIITLVVVAGLVGLAVRSMINCGQCKGHCD